MKSHARKVNYVPAAKATEQEVNHVKSILTQPTMH